MHWRHLQGLLQPQVKQLLSCWIPKYVGWSHRFVETDFTGFVLTAAEDATPQLLYLQGPSDSGEIIHILSG